MYFIEKKHIDTSYHLIHELVNDGQIKLLFCGFKEHLVNMFTKDHLGIDSAEDVLLVEIKDVC